MMKKLVFQFQNVIQNAHFVIELLEIVLKNSLMTFDKEYFQQIFGIIMGTNLAPILANLYLAMLQEELKKKCKYDTKLKWPSLFLRFIDDGFGIMEGTKQDVEYWISRRGRSGLSWRWPSGCGRVSQKLSMEERCFHTIDREWEHVSAYTTE